MRTLLYAIPLLLLAACAEPAGDGYEDRMAEEHQGDTTDATPMTDSDGVAVESGEVVYGEVNGNTLTGYMAVPAGLDSAAAAVLPGVIVIQEWWGLNDNIRAMADRLAGQGYRALAVDLYNGEVADQPEQARQLMSAAREDMDALRQNVVAAHTALTETFGAPQVGSIGWCFGGAMSLQTALALPEQLDAAVIYYGNLVQDEAQLATLSMPIIGFFGSEDGGIPVDGVRQFESTLNDLGKNVEIHVYDGADHAFANPTGQNYQEAAAEDSWEKTTAFFAEHLR
ncbi:MAG: dienelactone hydrolase family protein [Bacteroidota bacterium]